jgi:RecA/RadA recombinase
MTDKTLDAIRQRLGHFAIAWRPSTWLDTGIPDLNSVLGHKDRGIPFGPIIEISGWPSHGKTTVMLALAALAQQGGAHVVWGDVENSFSPGWAMQRGFAKCPKCNGTGFVEVQASKKSAGKISDDVKNDCVACGGADSPTCGLDTSRLTLIQPYVGHFTYTDNKGKKHKEKNPRLANAQELCSEIEAAMSGHDRCVTVLDSIAALLTEGESLAGLEDATMHTSLDLAKFMGRLLRRWVGLAQVNNCMIILVNQLREGPVKFGDPVRTTGGNAPKFYSHVRVRVARVAGAKIMNEGKMVGFTGMLTALKNKSGGRENAKVGFRLYFDGRPLEFISEKEAKKSDGE